VLTDFEDYEDWRDCIFRLLFATRHRFRPISSSKLGFLCYSDVSEDGGLLTIGRLSIS